MAVNRIGPLVFFSLSGPPSFVQQRTVARTRVGGEGKTIKVVGQWGDLWRCRSVEHVSTYAAAVIRARFYQAAAKGETLIVYEGVNLARLGHRYSVRDVRVLAIEPLANSTDGSLARIEALWDLEPVDATVT